MKSLTPNLMVADVARSLQFYCDVLGFTFEMGVAEEGGPIATDRSAEQDFIYAMARNGGACLMFLERNAFARDLPAFAGKAPGSSATFYMELDNLDGLHEQLHGTVTEVKAIGNMWYGMREWYIADPDGYVLCLAEALHG
ncbi:VOC family protein [Desulfovibrio mangrovi]|uniref:VOC family protein n=1 Tax=Desulfovibrio mangrovi TaxID=2976983 RepID=UPI00224706A0|nr:VOC family protein [Desulfovibrio mangrovi]UZP67734.1 VOC family protein [Desulfovibrio mangrovi]